MRMNRLVPALLALACLAPALFAADTDLPASLVQAKARAAAENKQLVIEFSGRTWCPPCKALYKEVISTEAFTKFTADRVVVHLDYPVRSERTPEKIAANPELAQLMAAKDAFEIQGFPTVVLLAPDGTELGRTLGYEAGAGPEAWIAELTAKK